MTNQGLQLNSEASAELSGKQIVSSVGRSVTKKWLPRGAQDWSQSSIWWDCEVQRSSSSEPPAAREVSTIPDFLSQVSQYVSFLVHSPFELFFSLPATKGAQIIHLPGPIQGARASSGQESSPPSWEPLVLILRPWELWRPPGQEAVFMTVKNTPSGLTVPINKKMLVISNVKYTFFLVIRHCFIYKNSFMWIKLSKLRFVESF